MKELDLSKILPNDLKEKAKKAYDEAIYYEGSRPSGLLVQLGDTISQTEQNLKEFLKGKVVVDKDEYERLLSNQKE